jgi:beta-N-acetylglucosaminidase
VVTPAVILLSIVQFAYLSSIKNNFFTLGFLISNMNTGIAYAALPTTTDQVSGAVEQTDSRVPRVQNFFHQYGSILEQYSQNFVDAADKYHIDYKLLPAIAMQESGGCKREIKDTHNCYGYGIYTHHTTSFTSYEEGIDTVSNALAKYYVAKGINTPEEIGKRWNPADTNDWTDKVKYFMGLL